MCILHKFREEKNSSIAKNTFRLLTNGLVSDNIAL